MLFSDIVCRALVCFFMIYCMKIDQFKLVRGIVFFKILIEILLSLKAGLC